MKIHFVSFFLLSLLIHENALTVLALTNSNVCSGTECYLTAALGESFFTDLDTKSVDSIIELKGVASVSEADNGNIQIESTLNLTKTTTFNCPSLENANELSTSELINRLTASCRYDKTERPLAPIVNGSNAIEVKARVYVYVLQDFGTGSFDVQALLQLTYNDSRLAFSKYAPKRLQPIQGESEVRNLIWVPHLFFANEQDSNIMGTLDKDILTSIAPDGTVIIASRIKATLFCWMELKRFPFDEQYCTTTIESWLFNATELMLQWEENTPVVFNSEMKTGQYSMENHWYNETIINTQKNGIWHGGFIGNYSSISFTVHMVHSAGHYIMDYFLPSAIMVAISWVSLWLRADQTPARTILCCSTMLSLITLGTSQLKSSSSFITILEIWFLVCVLFIFASLVEFAFSNTIFRRKKDVQLKKVNSRSILKSTVAPGRMRREACGGGGMNNCSSNGNLTTAVSSVSLAVSLDNSINSTIDSVEPPQTFATMTPQDISLWLDRRARFVFPLIFIIFNAFFWLFVLTS